MDWYLGVKLLHVFFVISWMAGVFYLPRIMVHYKVAEKNHEERRRLTVMARKLYRFSLVNLFLAFFLGLFLVYLAFDFSSFWVYAKTVVVLILALHFLACGFAAKQMEQGTVFGSERFWRFYNEVPALLLAIILFLVLFKPVL